MKKKIESILYEIKPELKGKKLENMLEKEGLNSFDIVRIIAELEEIFNIQFASEEREAENFSSIYSIHELVKSKVEKNVG